MLKSVRWSENRAYRSNSDNEPFSFYLNGLTNSTSFDLLLGYFSFSAINILSTGFASFIARGGKMRIVCNDLLSRQDKEAIVLAEDLPAHDALINLHDIGALKKSLDAYGRHFFNCVAWLIRAKRIEIVLVRPKDKRGISHYKEGLFSDGQNQVFFSGSCNFTAYGLVENLERIDAFLSWENGRSTQKIDDFATIFQRIFSRDDNSLHYVPIENVQEVITAEFGDKDINDLLIEERELMQMRVKATQNPKAKKLLDKSLETLEELISAPRFPYPEGPRDYQEIAYQRWVENGLRGIFAMATGTGKTITSLNCLLNECKNDPQGIYHALVLVPTITLVEQWSDEARSFNFQDVIEVSSKAKWESSLATTLSRAKRVATSFIIIATYASFTKDRLNKYIKQLPPNTLFIADEAHNIGSKSVRERLNGIALSKRIGLSATPKRVYDPEGTEAMAAFFDDRPPYTYSFSMERAITDGVLCQYEYYPHLVSLTSEELEEYAEISKKLARLYSPTSDGFESNEIAERLLLKRKRIIHKAENKLPKTIEILRERYNNQGNLKYTFVYVPEGFVAQPEDSDRVDEDNQENLRLINQYTSAIGQIDTNIFVNQFISGMPDRNQILDQFKKGQIQVIASMKCLDEGVDIPRAEHAVFCSSTGNPRQFIQRRGRILRRHKEKNRATIHDLIVIPDLSLSDKSSDTFKLERNMVKRELERVMYFASLSLNPYHTESLLEDVCNHFDLNIYTIYEELKDS